MGREEPRDPFKGVDWKAVGTELQKDPSAGEKQVIKNRLPRTLPLRSWPALYLYAFFGGIGIGMLVEDWVKEKLEGYIRNISETDREQSIVRQWERKQGNLVEAADVEENLQQSDKSA